jgi:hypothetical protein
VVNLDPFVPFEQQTKYFEDAKHAEYTGNSMGALIRALEQAGSIPSGIKAEDVIWASHVYKELKDYQTKTDALLKSAEGKQLSADKQALLDKARQHYGWYNFLDAYRLATAAVS